MHHALAVAAPLALLVSLAACGGGMRFEAMNMERPGEGVGLPPPVNDDYRACYTGHAEGLDTNSDGKPDYVRVKDDGGRDVCHGSDSDHDGNIDQWDVMDAQGKLKKRARDTNGDHRVDEHWTFDPTTQCATVFHDADGDGKPDTTPVDTCQPLNVSATPSPAAP